LFVEERQRLLEDATERRALFAGIQSERRRAAMTAEKRKRESDDEVGPSSAQKDGE
jgi:hypothetical protein